MKIIKTAMCALTVFILILCLSLTVFAINVQSLECNIDVEAELVENNLKITVNNKKDKDITVIKYAKSVFHNGEIFGGLNGIERIANYGADNIIIKAMEKNIVQDKNLYIPMNYSEGGEQKEYSYSDITVNLYFYYVEFADGSKWGNEYYNLDYVYNNIDPLKLQSMENQTELRNLENRAVNKKTLSKNDILTLLKGVGIIIVIIIIRNLFSTGIDRNTPKKKKVRKKRKNSTTSQTGIDILDQNKSSEEKVIKGIEGESEIANRIENSIFDEKYVLRNIYITKEDGKTSEIDIILIHKSGVYVIESKNYSGWIFGNEKNLYWTQSLYKGVEGTEKNKFYNPVAQNKNHVKYLKKYLGDTADSISFCPVVVFGNNAELKEITLTSDDAFVIHSNQVVETVEAFITIADARRKHLSSEKMKDIFEKLYPLTQVSDEVKKQHVEEIEKLTGESGSLTEEALNGGKI